jgi:hypothetical protein
MGNMGLKKTFTKKNPKCPKYGGSTIVKTEVYDPKSRAFRLRERSHKKCNSTKTEKW